MGALSGGVLFVNRWDVRLEVMTVLSVLRSGVGRRAHWGRFAHQTEEVV